MAQYHLSVVAAIILFTLLFRGGGVGGVIPPEDKLLENEEFVSDF
jgi:hypothetical protein